MKSGSNTQPLGESRTKQITTRQFDEVRSEESVELIGCNDTNLLNNIGIINDLMSHAVLIWKTN